MPDARHKVCCCIHRDMVHLADAATASTLYNTHFSTRVRCLYMHCDRYDYQESKPVVAFVFLCCEFCIQSLFWVFSRINTIVGSIFFLFFLGGYYFYVNIFYKEMVVEAFGEKFDEFSWIAHLLDVLLLLIHYWQLGVISKCRRFYQYIRVEDKRTTVRTTCTK
ncbi:hypothetical protein OESDEN_03003 [Oesophagostomum dentatum]|uniref:Uncharacterized protein n=1 Tax=Oesophagostomum dentatum TaxID=61180 RepID=A0A0B1TMI2_OESDE|nr:hypothetical protein OESDEN_03003 [Oesophagostomum dentatum]